MSQGIPAPGWIVLVAFAAVLLVVVLVATIVWRILGADIHIGVIASKRKKTSSCPTCGAALPANAPHGLCPKCLFRQALSTPEADVPAANSPGTGPFLGRTTVPTPAELAEFFPQLEILSLLGQGGMGAVYKARQIKLDRLVALKILPPLAGQDPAFAERFMREARALARVNHPQIVAVHDFGEAGGMFYFLMEFVDGVNLRQFMQAGRLESGRTLPIVSQICDALQYAHDEGIIHRDIKPENILLDKKGRIKIADFGLAKLAGPTPGKFMLTGSQQAMGTPHYMAPEQMERPQTVDQRADIYSLGVVFYEMLTGELPLGHFALPSQKSAIDERLDAVVLRALEKDPERRYQRVSELKTDLTGSGPAPLAAPGVPPFSYQEEVDLELQRFQVVGPAACLILTGILAFVNLTSLLIWSLFPQGYGPLDKHQTLLGTAGMVLIIVLSAVVIMGGRRMMNFESYGLAMLTSFLPLLESLPCVFFIGTHGDLVTANVLTMLASIPYVFILGVTAGFWSLKVLCKPEVKLAFARKAVRARLSTPLAVSSASPVRGKIGSMLGAIRSFMMVSRPQADPETQPSAQPSASSAEVLEAAKGEAAKG